MTTFRRTSARSGSDLFVVDNSDSDWKVLRYLHDWCQTSKSIDVATAYFEVGALLALDGEWQKIDRIRMLMGDEINRRTRAAVAQSVLRRVEHLDRSIEAEKERDDFLDGLPAIAEAIRQRRIQFRVYRRGKFHAKAYITHARREVVGSAALVGSSNFTRPGLTQNVELNVQITGGPVTVLQEWFDEHWEDGEDATADMLRTIERHVRPFTPFEVYARSLAELFRDQALSAGEWERGESRIYPLLDGYQREGYAQLLDIARRYNGAFLCDGVGLGKTSIGLMLIERLVVREKKRVVLLVPKSGRKPVWEKELNERLPQLAHGAFSGLEVLSHTDLGRETLENRLAAIKERADAIIIDEAHNFRHPGVAGEGDRRPSRYRLLADLARGKPMFLLTATPVNNSLLDLMHMIELFADEGAKLRQAPLGVQSLRGHFRQLERRVRDAEGEGRDELEGVDEDVTGGASRTVFESDRIVQHLVVQRSRAYVKESQRRENMESPAIFPDRDPPKVAGYHFSAGQRGLLAQVETAFNRRQPLFTLAIYNPEEFRRPGQGEAAEFDRGRLKQVVRLIRTGFLKRLESSTEAFDTSCQVLFGKLLAFVERNAATAADQRRLKQWKDRHSALIEALLAARAEHRDDEDDEPDEDVVSPEMLEAAELLNDGVYDVAAIVNETYEDLTQLAALLSRSRELGSAKDGKLEALISLLRTDPVLSRHKVLIFTEFRTTARYLARELRIAGIEGVEQVDSTTKLDRGEVIRRFAPYYNGSTSAGLGHPETRVLITTDVLSEGLNLQDATRLINYDLHWNPVRLM